MRALLVLLALAMVSCPPGAAQHLLRVCANPDNLPFSDRAERGFENRIAYALGDELGARVQFSWGASLEQHSCDVVIGAPAGTDTTRPYYRSSYVFLTRADRQLYFQSLDDPRLRPLKLGLEDHTPLMQALSRRGWPDSVLRGSPARLIAAVEHGDVDVGLVWGPIAGAFARGEESTLRISLINPGSEDQLFSFDVCVGVAKGQAALKAALERALDRRRDEIDGILREYGVPLAGLQ
ncbi:MAG: transporter substrate-binding domain-containing protein [Archangium sp.]|nr:transporter substrate-binding domain-containing protein [Archangium sp.]MDP3571255.1 transporter substrate-binding domain-containing protein [Archangium sp.]